MGWSSDHPRNLRYLGEISREIFLSKFEWHKKWPFPVLVTKHKGYFRHETQTSHTRSGHFSTELKCFYQQHSATMRSHNLRCGSEILAALLYRWIAGTQKRSKKYDHVLSCTIYIYLSYLTFDMERRSLRLTFDVLAPRWMTWTTKNPWFFSTNEATATWPAATRAIGTAHKAQLVAILRTNDLSQRKKRCDLFLNMFEAVCWLDWVGTIEELVNGWEWLGHWIVQNVVPHIHCIIEIHRIVSHHGCFS